MELFTLMGKFITNGKEASGDIDKVTNTAQKSESKIGSAMKKIGGAIVAAFAVQKIIAFGKQMIETSAKIKAMGAQFDQVFGNDAGAAMDKIKNQSKELGIHVDRLTTSWNSFGAQTKGAGMSAEASMLATEKATKLAADSAAFYDTSMETASASIASFMKGNFAAGDAIGVFTNANQMNQKSLDKYGKKWQDLNEAERQNLLLETVEKTYELNGAMGQATREADSWENVTGNLKATWDRFIATIGTPVLAVAVKVVQKITAGIETLQSRMGTFDFSFFDNIKRNFEFLKDGIKGVGDPDALDGIAGAFYKFGTTIGTVIDFFKENWPWIQAKFKETFDFIEQVWQDVGTPIFEFIVQMVQDVVNQFVEYWPRIQALVDAVFSKVKQIWETTLKPAFDAIVDLVKVVWDIFLAAWPWIFAVVETAFKLISDIWDNILKPVFDVIIELVKAIADKFREHMPQIQAAFQTMGDTLKWVYNNVIKPAIEFVGAIIKWLADKFREYIIPLVTNVIEWFEQIATGIKDKIEFARDKVQGAIAKITEFFDKVKGVKDTVLGIFDNIKDGIKEKIQFARDKVDEAIKKIKGFFDFKWSLPSIKLPSFSVTWSKEGFWGKIGDYLGLPGKPSLGVKWNALGGIFTKPTILNTAAGLQGFAEPSTGGEAILPLNKLVPIMSDAMKTLGVQNDTTLFAKMIDLLSIIASKNPNVYLDKKIVSRELYPEFDRALKNDIEKENWEFA